MKLPGVIVKIVGRAPVAAKIWEYEKFRCNLCGKIFEPDLPKEAIAAKDDKYDETARSMIALLKYGFGVPFYRQEKLQAALGIPLASSTQWDKSEQGADLIYPAFEEIKRQAAQGDIIHNDDTAAKILELMKDQDESLPKGMFTTGIVSIKAGRKIAVFFTGQKHAGQNFADLLNKRDSNRDPPIQMCDALSRNFSETDEVILTHCNVHARRNFVDIAENFPQDCRYVLKVYEQIYKKDRYSIFRVRHLSSEKREKLVAEALKWKDKKLDHVGLISNVPARLLGLERVSLSCERNRVWCSKLIYEAFFVAGIDLVPPGKAGVITSEDLTHIPFAMRI